MRKLKVWILLLCVIIVFEGTVVNANAMAPKISEPPIIFIPGVMGTNLYNSSTKFNSLTKVWPPLSINIVALGSYAKMSSKLYTRPIENQNAADVNREYGTLDVYKTMIDRLCKEFPNREVYFFSYDFRQDNTKTAQLLNEFIEGKGFDKVDIVCHSMGGLITSSYVSQFENNRTEKKVNKVVTFGTPYEGLTRTFAGVMSKGVLANEMVDGAVSINGIADLFLCLGGLNQTVKAAMPALAQLAPTKAYIENGDYFYQQTGTERYGFLNLFTRPIYSEINYDQYRNISNTIFGSNYSLAEDFHESIIEDGMNVLAKLDNSYFIVGTGQFTISTVKFNDKMEINEYLYEQQGDGAVPYLSGSMMKKLEKIDNSEQRFKRFEADHNGIMGYDPFDNFSGDEKALDYLIEVLKSGSSSITSDVASSDEYLVLKISAGSDIMIENGNEQLSTLTEEFSAASTFGRLDFVGETNDIMVCIKDTKAYDISVYCGDGESVDISVSRYDENGNLVAEEEYSEVGAQDEQIALEQNIVVE